MLKTAHSMPCGAPIRPWDALDDLYAELTDGAAPARTEDVNEWSRWQRAHYARLAPRRQRKPRQPTLASVAKQASKAGIDAVGYEVKPDRTIVIVTGKSESTEPNPWLDDLRRKEGKR